MRDFVRAFYARDRKLLFGGTVTKMVVQDATPHVRSSVWLGPVQLVNVAPFLRYGIMRTILHKKLDECSPRVYS